MHSGPADRFPSFALCLATTGVVYGDIGTSPLYTWNELLRTGTVHDPQGVVGAASLLFWTLTIAVHLKYVRFVIRADNQGEGGTFALMGLLRGVRLRGARWVVGALTFAACLLYADGMITPPISILGALEGLVVFRPAWEAWVVPAALGILTALFAVQSAGTARVGRAFGVITAVWFVVIGAIGAVRVLEEPGILWALSPVPALRYLASHGLSAQIAILGAAVLAITGGEALYADLGHFGARAIRFTWSWFVYPALCLNYLGQGAWLLGDRPVAHGNVFFSTVPTTWLAPVLLLSVAAAVVASQALISGAFSLTRSAIQLGLVPRMRVLHTSPSIEGQVYLPAVNGLLWLGCCTLTVAFGSASSLAAAYGLAVMGVALATASALGVVATTCWGWSVRSSILVFGSLSLFDAMFLLANAVKLPDGAWLSLVVALGLGVVMWSWQRGRQELAAAYDAVDRVSVGDLEAARPTFVEIPRALVFLVSQPVCSAKDAAPILLLRFLDLHGALPRCITLFSVVHERGVPRWDGERFDVMPVSERMASVRMHVGFAENVDVRAALHELRRAGRIRLHPERWTIVVGREELAIARGGLFWRSRTALFVMLSRVAAGAHRWFGLWEDTGLAQIDVPVVASPSGMVVHVRLPEAFNRPGP